MHVKTLTTDLYQLTMMAGYFKNKVHNKSAVFDLFFRKNPFGGSFAIFSGLQQVIDYIEELSFSHDDIKYLESLNLFSKNFLDYLFNFEFTGTITSVKEGSVVFPSTPLITVEGNLAEVQLIETALLNIVNYQSLVATKAARVSHSASPNPVIEFGLRRAPGPNGALYAARAAYVGGVHSTSNVEAGKHWGIPVAGTMAHSWIMSFQDELSAFKAYAKTFPDTCSLLLDTYDTLKSGLPNAILVAKELEKTGHKLKGVRLDSGDLCYLSKIVREELNKEGLDYVKIIASNELDETFIQSIKNEGGKVDIYGVGTSLVTCNGENSSLGGVYKLVSSDGIPKLKTTNDPIKATLPGKKNLYRLYDKNKMFLFDVMATYSETIASGTKLFDPNNPLRNSTIPAECTIENIREVIIDNGKLLKEQIVLDKISSHRKCQMERTPPECLRLINPHRYKVSISEELHNLRVDLIYKVMTS